MELRRPEVSPHEGKLTGGGVLPEGKIVPTPAQVSLGTGDCSQQGPDPRQEGV